MKFEYLHTVEINGRPTPICTVSCGCCVNGCVCWIHQDTPRGIVPKQCDWHKEHGHPHVTCRPHGVAHVK